MSVHVLRWLKKRNRFIIFIVIMFKFLGHFFVCLFAVFFHVLARIFICLPLLVVQPYIVRNMVNDVTDELTCS